MMPQNCNFLPKTIIVGKTPQRKKLDKRQITNDDDSDNNNDDNDDAAKTARQIIVSAQKLGTHPRTLERESYQGGAEKGASLSFLMDGIAAIGGSGGGQ
mmetsp:Transcript_2268/g.4193  ORF Transcript_2268/g.4193 Transcript_2268/m.4193 type:complete len:99 (-) Transcript_2268:17-313(-)